ncbi:hypothetical protein GGS23DRAFT_61773 [Durotheca rogersii]|uniref:uncharacterized protein n=1 Tax=Durotheca rogersii TaxID=419775 RepID=UPI002221263F|nr:uncharacterized protein GGS23DRAFT_61773 [Durotheca rogersii]KAI5863266.1 hypothetical protein GGS23DRAFT_61773 [Durotheca rogersii]
MAIFLILGHCIPGLHSSSSRVFLPKDIEKLVTSSLLWLVSRWQLAPADDIHLSDWSTKLGPARTRHESQISLSLSKSRTQHISIEVARGTLGLYLARRVLERVPWVSTIGGGYEPDIACFTFPRASYEGEGCCLSRHTCRPPVA